jgi:hypothetical protein
MDSLEKLKKTHPHLFSGVDPVAALAEVGDMLARLDELTRALKGLKMSLAPKVHWQKKRATRITAATTTGADGIPRVNVDLLSPADAKRIMGQ